MKKECLKQNRFNVTKRDFLKAMLMASLFVFAVALVFRGSPAIYAFADSEAAIESAVNVVVTVLNLICIVIGGIYLVSGLVKYAIAHGNDQGNEQNSALKQAASGLVLVLLGSALLATIKDDIIQIIKEAIN